MAKVGRRKQWRVATLSDPHCTHLGAVPEVVWLPSRHASHTRKDAADDLGRDPGKLEAAGDKVYCILYYEDGLVSFCRRCV